MPTTEAQRAATKRWIANNRDRWNAYQKAYRQKNPDKVRRHIHGSNARLFAKNPVAYAARNMLGNVRARSKAAGLSYDLDQAWIEAQIRMGCPLTGRKFTVVGPAVGETHNGALSPNAPSIDRIDSSKGYTRDNCRVVVAIANYAKNKFTDADLIALCRDVVKQHAP